MGGSIHIHGTGSSSVGDIRRFYYAYLFNERPFGTEDFAKRPAFTPRTPGIPSWNPAWGPALLAWLIALLGLWRLGCLRLNG